MSRNKKHAGVMEYWNTGILVFKATTAEHVSKNATVRSFKFRAISNSDLI